MSIHKWFHDRNDPVQAAREQENSRVRRWDDALKAEFRPPLQQFLDGGHKRPRFALPSLTRIRAAVSGLQFRPRINARPMPVTPGLGLIRTVFGATLAVLFAVATALAGYVYFGEDPLVAEAAEAVRCSKATMLRQEDGQVILVPVDASPHCISKRSHLSVAFDDPVLIERRADRIAALEGRYRIGETISGFEWWGLMRWAAGKDGFSGPILSAFEGVLGQTASLRGQPIRKLRNVMASMQYARIFLRTDADRAAFLVNHMPVLSGMRIDPIAGPYADSILFTGNEPEIVRDCLFAASAGFPINLNEPGERLDTTWRKATGRAKACIRKTAVDHAESTVGLAYLDQMAVPEARHAKGLRQPVLNAVVGFNRRHGRDVLGTKVALTLDSGMQAELLRSVPEVLKDLDRKTRDKFCAIGDDCSPHLDALVAMAEITDDKLLLRAVYNTRQGLLFGPVRKSGDQYMPVADRLGNASLNKLLLLLPVARAGDEVLCNRKTADFRNVHPPAGVVACNPKTGAGYVPVTVAVRKSLNLPWIDAARNHKAEAAALEDALEFLPFPRPETASELAMGFGRYGAPAKMMTLAAALVNDGRINGLTLYEEVAVQGLAVADLGYSASDIAKAARWFKAPLQSGGTMASAAAALKVRGCTMTHGKSGTVFADGRNQARYGLAVVQCGPRRFVIYAGVSGKRAEYTTGRINQPDLTGIYRRALAAR